MSMSNREAINRIKDHMERHHIGEYPHIHLAEAFEMAIAALQEKEQKYKNIGCEFCKRFDFSTARTETDKYGARILLAGGVSTFPKEKCFKFCPECGRKLP